MIRVILKTRDKDIKGFSISGHANYDVHGSDIVCSAVSMLVFNTIDTITDLLRLEGYIKYTVKKNVIELDLIKELDDTDNKYFQLIMRKLELGIKSIIQKYQNYVKLNYTEV